MEKTQKNPMEFVYEEGQMVEVPGNLLTDLITRFEVLTMEETKSEVEFQYSYWNPATKKTVENPSQAEIDEGVVVKVPDHGKMMEAPVKHTMTEKGVEFMNLRYFLAKLHQDNIDKGLATHIEELKNKEIKKD